MGCPNCGQTGFRELFRATDRLYQTTSKMFQVVECSACRLIRLEPRPSVTELSQYYPQEYWYAPEPNVSSQLEEAYRRFVLRDHLSFILRAVRDSGQNGPVLDVGCGGGLLLRMLQDRGLTVLGLDNSAAAAEAAWRYNGVRVLQADLSQPPIRAGTCTAITMFHVVEHLYDPALYLEHARALLTRNGRLVVQVPNAASLQFRLFGSRWNGADVPRHLVDYRQRDLERLLEQSGFEVVRRKHFSLRDNPAGFASSLAPGLDPMARRVRKIHESMPAKLAKDLVYFGLVLFGLPFAAFEAALGAGSTIMVEARKNT